jgi:hypothetical protein
MVLLRHLLAIGLVGVSLIGSVAARPVPFSISSLVDDIKGAVDKVKNALWPSTISGSTSSAHSHHPTMLTLNPHSFATEPTAGPVIFCRVFGSSIL